MLRRTALVLALTGLLAGGAAALPTGAVAADPVRVAEAEQAALRAEVDATAARLGEAARALEAGRGELQQVERSLEAARRAAQESTASAGTARDRLASVAAAAYRSPVPDGLALALSSDPDSYVDAVVARADLARARGSATDLLRDATAERVRAAGAVREVEQLTAEVASRTRSLEQAAAAMRSEADRVGKRLAEAEVRLGAARRRASRDRVLATCSGGTVRGGANGFLDPAALCPLEHADGHALRADAAAAFNRMTDAALAERGTALCVNDSYRSYAGQVSVFRRIPRLAAVPGTSLHGLGIAVDLGCGAERFGSATYRWLKANAGRFGWHHPAWAEPRGALPEPWHWEYRG